MISKDGSIVHRWDLEYPIAGQTRLYPNGDLVYIGRHPDSDALEAGKGGVIQRVDASGDVVRTIVDYQAHHDFECTITYLRWSPMSEAETRCGTGRPRRDRG